MGKEKLYSSKSDSYYEESRRELIPLVPRGAKSVLEVGCGNGAFARELRKILDARIVGIELNEHQAARARQDMDEVLVGDIEEILPALDDSQYDLIIFNDVLEHLIAPWNVVNIAKAKLKAGGAIFAAIPNVRHWSVIASLVFGAEWRYGDYGLLDRSHLRFFTARSAARMFVESEFDRITLHRPLKKSSKSAMLNLLTFGLFIDFLASHNVFVARK